MYVGLKQPRGDGERCVTPARAAAKETRQTSKEQTKMPRFMLESPRPSTIVCFAFIHCA